MTTIILFAVCATVVIFLLLFAYLRKTKHLHELQNNLNEKNHNLKILQETETQLREEVSILEKELRHTLADPITNTLGWQFFTDRVTQSLKDSERHQFTLGILYVDINNFKMINEALSYEIGDKLLKAVAKRLQNCLRTVDSLSRVTKDTFVILITQVGKPEAAAVIAQRILQAMKEPLHIGEHELYITASIGISTYPTDGQDTETLLRNAEEALLLAKQKGRNVYQFYQERLHLQSQRELAMHTSINRENIFQEFILYYLPIMHAQTKIIFCMDALIHWQHPQLGLINTAELISYAEKHRKSNLISEWLLENACKQFMHWRSLGFSPKFLGIPLSIKQLENIHFVYRISQILQDAAFNPEWLILEIKETSTEIPRDILEKAFNMLRYLGIKIALDDFGAEAFSLGRLTHIHINYLKLAQELIVDINDNKNAQLLMKSIIAFAQGLNIEVIAQGVNNEDQAIYLNKLGIELMQGQFLAMPLSENEIEEKMLTTLLT